ncbi:MAG: agmatinase [Flavobacteriaceae bacterium]|nr:agmatinase [Flavobacteriaceae bacterium]
MSNQKTFGGIPEEFGQLAKAKIVLIPVTYDGTSTYQKGADKGPNAFLDAAENLELYDIETDSEVYKEGIYLADTITEDASPEAVYQTVYNKTKEYIAKNKFVTLFGGEHSISIGAIKAHYEHYDNLTIVQIDAHADLRKSYQGSPYNHACALYDASQNADNLIQIGIRSMDKSEKTVMDYDKVFFAHEMLLNEDWMEDAIDLMTDDVYITFDLDALDPSIFPGTGTPEPGGLMWYETLEFIQKIMKERNVVGFDLVELCPIEGTKVSEFLAAKLYYKMLSYKFAANDEIIDDDDEEEDNSNKIAKFKSNE